MATFVIQPVQQLLNTLQKRIDEIIEPVDPDLSLKLDISMAFKDAQIQLLELLKDVSSKEYCSQLKESFTLRPQLDQAYASELNQKLGKQHLAHKSQMSQRSSRLSTLQIGATQQLLQSERKLEATLGHGQNLDQRPMLPAKKQQQLMILQRTQSLLLGKIERLLQQDIPNEEEPNKHSEADHAEISKQVEELSGYLGKVEEQIQSLLKDVKRVSDSALDVADLQAPPLTERADVKINNFVPRPDMINDLETKSERQEVLQTHIQVNNTKQVQLEDAESKMSWEEESTPVPLQFS